MGAAYGPGLLPCITAVQNPPPQEPPSHGDSVGSSQRERPIDALSDELLGIEPPSESEHIELLCQFATLNFIPLFHEAVGDVVYRFINKDGQIHVSPIPDKINSRVMADIRRHTATIDTLLLDWLETPLLIPGAASRRDQIITLPGYPLDGWRMGNLRSERNTLNWLYTEAKENHDSSRAVVHSGVQTGLQTQTRRARGYTATLGTRHGYEPLIQAYEQLLACWDYCDRFKFIGRVLR